MADESLYSFAPSDPAAWDRADAAHRQRLDALRELFELDMALDGDPSADPESFLGRRAELVSCLGDVYSAADHGRRILTPDSTALYDPAEDIEHPSAWAAYTRLRQTLELESASLRVFLETSTGGG